PSSWFTNLSITTPLPPSSRLRSPHRKRSICLHTLLPALVARISGLALFLQSPPIVFAPYPLALHQPLEHHRLPQSQPTLPVLSILATTTAFARSRSLRSPAPAAMVVTARISYSNAVTL